MSLRRRQSSCPADNGSSIGGETILNTDSTSSQDEASSLSASASASASGGVVGSTRLYQDDGKIRYVPMPTPDPKDPLNLPPWRKWAAVGVLCFFGALAQASEAIIASLLPVFLLEYHDINPKILGDLDLSTYTNNPSSTASSSSTSSSSSSSLFPPGKEDGPTMSQVTLLSTAPMLISGLACWFLVPLSIAIGRRPVMLLAGFLAWSGGIWAACSGGLASHVGARCLQALGAGTIDSLIPLILQDLLFIHERNKAVAAVNSSTGLIIVTIGVTSPLIVVDIGWRWVYGITSIATFVSWIGILFLVPESRWIRSPEELAGQQVYPLPQGATRPQLDPVTYGPRTTRHDLSVLNVVDGSGSQKNEWSLALQSLWLSVKTLSFPNVIWCILIDAIFMGLHNATSQFGASLLITGAGWQFTSLGLAVLPIVIASPFVWLFGGFLADKFSNARARRHPEGRREPESHMLSMIVPILFGFVGPLVYGYVASNIAELPAWQLLLGSGFVSFANPTIQSLVSTYLIECYPNFAGPVLVTVSTFRLVIGFLLSLNVTGWVESMGFLPTFGIFSGLVGLAAITLPLIFLFGHRIRAWSGGRLDRTTTAAVGGLGKKTTGSDMELQSYPSGKEEVDVESPGTEFSSATAAVGGGGSGDSGRSWQCEQVRGESRPGTDDRGL